MKNEAKPRRGGAPPSPPKPRLVTPEARDALRYRERRGISQKDFAEEFGLSFYTYRQWENGDREPGRAGRLLLRVIVMFPDKAREAAAAKPPFLTRL